MARHKTAAAVTLDPEPAPAPGIRDRIIDFRRVKASDLVRNDLNWRLHPEEQQGALAAMLDDVGFVGAVIARQTEGDKLEIIDGHLRADTAGDAEVPVLVVDLDEKEAAKVLATYDPLSQMAETDADALSELLQQADFDLEFGDNAHLRKMLSDIDAKLAKEELKIDRAIKEKEIPDMALEPHEHYDYLVILATTTHDWNVLLGRLNLEPRARRGRMGTSRAIRAAALLDLLPKD